MDLLGEVGATLHWGTGEVTDATLDLAEKLRSLAKAKGPRGGGGGGGGGASQDHEGQRPYPCEFPGCGFRATRSYDLKRHKLTHTGERPFPCDAPGCGYSATRSDHLKRHKKTHSTVRLL